MADPRRKKDPMTTTKKITKKTDTDPQLFVAGVSAPVKPRSFKSLKSGDKLERTYHGKKHTVLVRGDGEAQQYILDDRKEPFDSLTAIAMHLMDKAGASGRVSGMRFFGLAPTFSRTRTPAQRKGAKKATKSKASTKAATRAAKKAV
jgi:hypothetical protein